MSSALQEFSQNLAAILPELHSERLPALLLSMLNSLVPFDNAVILSYTKGETPQVHYNDIPPLDRETQIDAFITGPFVLDPFYRAAVDHGETGLHRLCDLAPEGFEKSEYYRCYF